MSHVSKRVKQLVSSDVLRGTGVLFLTVFCVAVGSAQASATNRVGVYSGPGSNGSAALNGLVRAIDRHPDCVLTPLSADKIKAGEHVGYDVLVVPMHHETFAAEGGTVVREDDGTVEVLRRLRILAKRKKTGGQR